MCIMQALEKKDVWKLLWLGEMVSRVIGLRYIGYLAQSLRLMIRKNGGNLETS